MKKLDDYSEILNEFTDMNIEHYIEEINCKEPYNINIFCCFFEDCDVLKKNYKNIVDAIALNIQANNRKKIEIYNFYTLFFVDGDKNFNIANEIESDLYSTRKIVIFDKLDSVLNKLEKIIQDKLFCITESDITQNEFNSYKVLKDYENEEFKNYVKNYENKKNEIDFDLVYNLLGGEKN